VFGKGGCEPPQPALLATPAQPGGAVTCEGHNARKSAGQLDLQLAIELYQAKSLDQAADGSRGFFTKLGAVQLLTQPGDLVR
jgi:hypothetical protein